MDLRDQIAIEVMKAEVMHFDCAKDLSAWCYEVAEEMLNERVRSMN